MDGGCSSVMDRLREEVVRTIGDSRMLSVGFIIALTGGFRLDFPVIRVVGQLRVLGQECKHS